MTTQADSAGMAGFDASGRLLRIVITSSDGNKWRGPGELVVRDASDAALWSLEVEEISADAGRGVWSVRGDEDLKGLADRAKDATPAESLASEEQDDTLTDLIAMSQMLEIRLKGLRDGTGALPGQSALYVAELEDMVAMVDGELSFDPESLDLWGQRVNLLLDLEYIYQHQWEREYGRMASLN